MGEGDGEGGANERCGREIGLHIDISLFRGVGGNSSVRACQVKDSFSLKKKEENRVFQN